MLRDAEDFAAGAGVVGQSHCRQRDAVRPVGPRQALALERVPYRFVVEPGRVLGLNGGVADMEMVAVRLREADDGDLAIGSRTAESGRPASPCSRDSVRSCSGLSLSGLDFGGIGSLVRGCPARRTRNIRRRPQRGGVFDMRTTGPSSSSRPAFVSHETRYGRVPSRGSQLTGTEAASILPSDCSHTAVAASDTCTSQLPPSRMRLKQRRHRSGRRQIAGGIIKHRAGDQLGQRFAPALAARGHEGTLLDRKPGRGLRQLLPAAPSRPGAVRAIGRDRDIGDARRDMGQRRRRKAEPGKRARPVGIHEEMRAARQPAQSLGVRRLGQIEKAGACPRPYRDRKARWSQAARRGPRARRRRRRQKPRTSRTRQHPRQIEHANASSGSGCPTGAAAAPRRSS